MLFILPLGTMYTHCKRKTSVPLNVLTTGGRDSWSKHGTRAMPGQLDQSASHPAEPCAALWQDRGSLTQHQCP